MGVDYSSRLLVVIDKNIVPLLEDMLDPEEYEDYGDVNGVIEELGLDYASPWYDADISYWTIGFRISNPTYDDLRNQESEWWDEFNKYGAELNRLFGEGEISLEAHQHIY